MPNHGCTSGSSGSRRAARDGFRDCPAAISRVVRRREKAIVANEGPAAGWRFPGSGLWHDAACRRTDDIVQGAARRQAKLVDAGAPGEPLFAAEAGRELSRRSRGIPRLVNIIAHKSMMLAFGEGAAAIGKAHVALAADDTAAVANAPGRASWLERLRLPGASRAES